MLVKIIAQQEFIILPITYSTFPVPEAVFLPYIFITGPFLYELLFSYLSFTYCRNMVGKNIPLDILLVASAIFKTFLFRRFEFGASNN